jgi:hypothetical protein
MNVVFDVMELFVPKHQEMHEIISWKAGDRLCAARCRFTLVRKEIHVR